jgi:hypothetical protein
VAGAPRSGTTWLAKILDSHPDVIYRHEPDETAPPHGSMRESVAEWIGRHDARAACKRPFFRKSWQSGPGHLAHTALAFASGAAGRIGLPAPPVPDCGDIGRARAVIKSVRLRTELGRFAEECPNGRVLFIVRDPRGQVDSVIRGAARTCFDLATEGTDMPFDESRVVAHAARHGVDAEAFQRLPDAAKYAWSWREFNESAYAAIEGRPNVRVVIHRDLCVRPRDEAAELLRFAGLDWREQTEGFVASSTTHDGPAGYYSVLRDSRRTDTGWQSSLSRPDLDAICAVVRDSPLARLWPDLAA